MPANVHRLNEEVARLRRFRSRAEPDVGLGRPLQEVCRHVQQQSRGTGRVHDAWFEVVPPHLARQTTVMGLSRGVLTVRTANSAVRFQVHRFLRSGGESQLHRAAAAPIRRVRLA